ncbi:elongation factor 1-beta isoform X1 [Hydra vulgaris]|uniref:Elongation factor 1-beta n=1 Tax=Hydra vulgaris TaxID=6087 RepID=T2MH09_HYDVU|nr:elongation factor 1-beta [Hydra vulgaris]
MGFGDLKTDAGIKSLNEYLADKSYIEGYVATQADTAILKAIASAPNNKYPHALRWYNHINSFTVGEQSSFPGETKDAVEYGPRGTEQAKVNDDDIDLFGDEESEEETEEEKRIKEKRLADYHAKKATKTALIAKSMLVLDVKPWDDETDMAILEEKVRSIQADGLLWGTSKLMPVGYGIKKLQITAVIEDDKIFTDWLEEEILKFSDHVQSMDIAAFNKL